MKSRSAVLVFSLLLPSYLTPIRAIFAADHYRNVGKSSCGSATCHGGVSGKGPAWNSSLRTWEATDVAHAGAGGVLLNDLSRHMVAGIATGWKRDPTPEEFVSTLRERCVSCHAPAAHANAPGSQLVAADFETLVRQGVQCEACHGPASVWLEKHVQASWREKWLAVSEPPVAESAAVVESVVTEYDGMLATEDWIERTKNCSRCHVGSRTADGLLRDVNHDLIAAGHPVLRFDMSLYQAALPVHWKLEPAQGATNENITHLKVSQQARGGPSHQRYEIAGVGEHWVARLQTLATVAKLAKERVEASNNGLAPFPEFAEYKCYDCHHAASITRQLNGSLDGQANWNGWYLVDSILGHRSLQRPPASFSIRRPPSKSELNRLQAVASGIAVAMLGDKVQLDDRSLENAPNDDPLTGNSYSQDWEREAVWYWTKRLELAHLDETDQSPAVRSQLHKVLDAFEETMDFGNSVDFIFSGPERVDFVRLADLRKQFRYLTASLPPHNSTRAERP